MSTPLTPHEVEQFLSLRLALEDALDRSRRASRYRRGAAVVALDAVVERASAIVAFTRGIAVPTNGKLDDLISRLKDSLGTTWQPTVLPDIKHLRRARNAAQHEGLEPDREQLPVWAGAAESYVTTLVDAQFSVDIRRIMLADAIRDGHLRDLIHQAEQAREAHEYRNSVDLSRDAYAEALSRWKRLRGRGSFTRRPSASEILDRKSYNHVQHQIGELQATMDAAAFSTDPADAQWFTTTTAEHGDVLDAEDAERVLTFSFEWITEYERAAATWTPDRHHRADIAARLTRSQDGPARIHDCETSKYAMEMLTPSPHRGRTRPGRIRALERGTSPDP